LSRVPTIWLFALGYLVAYVPYGVFTKALSSGLGPFQGASISGVSLLPVSTMAAFVAMVLTLMRLGWWRYVPLRTLGPLKVRTPTMPQFLSGLCTAGIATTTTLAYTFDGVSIVFVMLLMRGGVLVLAPVVDILTRRPTRWYSWVGLALSMGALVVAFTGEASFGLTAACALDVGIYLGCYFIRLQIMSRKAKSDDPDATRGYFVGEQMTAIPAVVLLLGLFALGGSGDFSQELRFGFTEVLVSSTVWAVALIGILSQGTGVFGTLVLLDRSENTYSVPVNRSSSILAGVIASFVLAGFFGAQGPAAAELVGAALVVVAIVVMSLAPVLERRRKSAPPVVSGSILLSAQSQVAVKASEFR
jgi:hypothetical protein